MKNSISRMLSILMAVAITVTTMNTTTFANETMKEAVILETENQEGIKESAKESGEVVTSEELSKDDDEEIVNKNHEINKENFSEEMTGHIVSLNYIYDSEKAEVFNAENKELPLTNYLDTTYVGAFLETNVTFAVKPKEGYTIKGISFSNPDGSKSVSLRAKRYKSTPLGEDIAVYELLYGKSINFDSEINIEINVVKIESKAMSIQYKNVDESYVKFYIDDEEITPVSNVFNIENTKAIIAKWEKSDENIIKVYKITGEEKEELYVDENEYSEDEYECSVDLGRNFEDCTIVFEAVKLYKLNINAVLPKNVCMDVESIGYSENDGITSNYLAYGVVASSFTVLQSEDIWLNLNYDVNNSDELENSNHLYIAVYETVNGVKKEITPVKASDLWDEWNTEDYTRLYPVKYESDKTITIEIKEAPKTKILFKKEHATLISDNTGEEIADSVIGYLKNNFYFSVEPEDGYVIDSVELSDENSGTLEYDESTGQGYVIPFKSSVTVIVKAIPAPKTVTFTNCTEYEAKIETNDKIVKKEDTDEYIVKYNADEILIDVFVKNKDEKDVREPKVGLIGDESVMHTFASTKQEKTSDGIYYYYSIPASTFTDYASIFVENIKNDDVTLEIKGNEFISDIFVTNGRKNVQPNKEGKYELTYGDTVDIKISALDKYCVGTVNIDYDGTVPDVSKTFFNQSETIRVPVRGNIVVDIDSMLKGDIVIKNSHNVVIEKYNASAFEFSDVFYIGPISYYKLPSDKYTLTFEVDGEKMKISNPSQGYNSHRPYGAYLVPVDEYTLLVSPQNYCFDYSKTLAYSFDVTMPNGKVFKYGFGLNRVSDLDGIRIIGSGKYYTPSQVLGYEDNTGECTLTCPVDMDNRITISAINKNGKSNAVNYSLLKSEISAGDEDKIELINNKTIRTKSKTGTGTITLYTDYKGERKNLAVINVNVVEPTALTEQTIRTYEELYDADDTSVVLAVREPVGTTRPAAGKQYFKVVSKEKGSTETKTLYFEREAVPYKDYTDLSDAGMERTDKENEAIENNFRQYIRCKVSDLAPGKGKAADYDLSVSMIWVMPEDTIDAPSYESKALSVTASTKEPSYETNLSLQKKQTTVYTGQKDVVIAVAGFSSTTVNKGVTALDVSDISEDEKLDIKVSEDGKTIYASVSENVIVGKHRIEVSPVMADTMYIQPLYVDVNVLQGINTISLTNVPSTIYKKPGSAAALQVSAILNEGGKKPASNKVTYELLDVSGRELDQDGNIKITSSGKINILKNYDPSEEDNSIRVKVTAADYAGNETQAISDVIRIETKPLEIGCIKLLQWDSASQTYVSKGMLDSKGVLVLTSDEVDNTMVVAFEKGVADKSVYSKSEVKKSALTLSDVSISCTNKTLLQNKEDGYLYLTATNVVNAVPIKVTALDGGKKNASQKITVTYCKPEKLYLSVNDKVVNSGDTITFDGNANTVIDLQVLENNPDGSENPVKLIGLTKYKLAAAKGGKIISQDIINGTAKAIVTAEQATFTLEDAKKNKMTVTVKNNSYKTNAAPSAKTTQTFKCDTDMEQSLVVSLNSKDYNMEDKYVLVETDAISAYAVKTRDAYATFENAVTEINNAEPVKITKSEGKYILELHAKDVPVQASKYKVALTFGSMTDGKFVPDAKPSYMTISVAKPKVIKGTFKPVTKFTFDTAKGIDSIEMTATGNAIKNYEFCEIYNANVGGKENDFADYFEIDTDIETGKQSIKLASGLSDEDISYLKSAAGKKDLQGYVSYTVTYGDDGYGNAYTSRAIVKLQIIVK